MKKFILSAAILLTSFSTIAANDNWVDVINPETGEVTNRYHEGTYFQSREYTDEIAKKAYAGAAGAAAMSNIPQIAGFDTTIGFATGYYAGEQSFAAGVIHRADSNIAFKASAAFGTEVMLGAGVGIGF